MSNDNWISVKDRLPENLDAFSNDRVLFLEERNNIVRIGCYDYEFGDWTESDGGVYKNVTHWQPLPEPPKVEKQEA